MAVLTHDRPQRATPRIIPVLTALAGVVMAAAQRVIAPHKASLSNLASIPLTVAGTGCVDFAAFHLPHGWGWLVTGISLIVLEHLIADESA